MIIEGILCFIMFYNVFQDIYLLMSKTYKIHKTKATTDYNFTVCGLRFCDGRDLTTLVRENESVVSLTQSRCERFLDR